MVRVERCEDPAPLRALMNDYRAETIYALGDLHPPHWDYSTFWGGFDGDTLLAFVLLYHGFDIPTLLMHGENEAVKDIMAAVKLPPEVMCLVPLRHRPTLTQYYDLTHVYSLLRMVATRQTYRPPTTTLEVVTRLGVADLDRLNAFYQTAAEPGEEVLAFSPSQVAHGVFYAVEENGQIIAAGGTHIVSPQESVAAVGNIFTAPDARNRGLATRITAAVTGHLLREGISMVALNVKAENGAAIRVYERLGYQTHGPFLEGPARLL